MRFNERCKYILLPEKYGVFINTCPLSTCRWLFLVLFTCTTVAPGQAQSTSAEALTDSLWSLEQLDDETREDVPRAAPVSTQLRTLRARYSMLAEPGPGQARSHLDLAWEPAPWISMKASAVRQRGEALRFRPREQWLGGEHTMAYAELRRQGARLVLGDFRIRSAASVSDFTSRNLVVSRAHPERSALGHTGMRPYAGAAEGPAPRGVAAQLPLGPHASLLAFASRRREDGDGRRRSRLVAAHGLGVRTGSSHYSASLSWTRFRLGQPHISWLEAGLSVHSPGVPVRAGVAVAVRGAKRAHVRMAEVTWSLPATSVTAWRHDLPSWNISPWGSGSRVDDRDRSSLATGLAIRSRVGGRAWLATGVARQTVTRLEAGRAPLRQSEAYARVDSPRIVAEWRVVMADQDALAAAAPAVRIRTVESTRRHRTAITLKGGNSARWNWSLRGLAASSRGLSAQLRRAGERRRLVLTRAVTWGRTPEAWAVIYTDRMPGHMGLLRASRPRTVQMVRFESRGGAGRSWTLAALVETDMETGEAEFTWALAWSQ